MAEYFRAHMRSEKFLKFNEYDSSWLMQKNKLCKIGFETKFIFNAAIKT